MTRRRAVALSIFAVVLAGCGSSSSSSGVSESSYRDQVNKLCANNNAQIKALPASTANSVSGLSQINDMSQKTLSEIKSVTPPSSLSSDVNSWLGVIDQEATLANQIIAALKAGNINQAKSLASQAQSLDTQGNSKASALGLSDCAVSAQPSGK